QRVGVHSHDHHRLGRATSAHPRIRTRHRSLTGDGEKNTVKETKMLQTVLPTPLKLELHEVDVPVPARGEVVVRVLAVTLCGSDVRVWKGEKTGGVAWPATIGHELAGEIAAVGEGVSGYAEGDRVSLAPWFTCGACTHCLSGETNLCDNMEVFGYGI